MTVVTVGTTALRAAREQFAAAIDLVLDELKNPDIAEDVRFHALETMGDLETAAKFAELGQALNAEGNPKPSGEPGADDTGVGASFVDAEGSNTAVAQAEQDPASAGVDAPVDGSPDASMEPAAS